MRRSRAFTLIEVVAALLIVGGMMATLVVGHARLVRQTRAAELQYEGVQLAEQLLNHAWQRTGTPRAGESRTGPGHPQWQWRTEVVPSDAASTVAAQVVRLVVFCKQGAVSIEVITDLTTGHDAS